MVSSISKVICKSAYLRNGLSWKLCLLLLTLTFGFNSFAQTNITVTGTVQDATGTPLSGASVQVKGRTSGTYTKSDGTYSIQAPDNGTLVISYVGYGTREIAVTGSSLN